MSVHGIEDDKRPNQNKYIKMYQDYKEKVNQFAVNVQSSDKGSIFGFGFNGEQTAVQN